MTDSAGAQYRGDDPDALDGPVEAVGGQMDLPSAPVREIPVGLAEIAALCGVKRETADTWRIRGVLPDEAFVISGSPGWWLSDIEAWARSTGRL